MHETVQVLRRGLQPTFYGVRQRWPSVCTVGEMMLVASELALIMEPYRLGEPLQREQGYANAYGLNFEGPCIQFASTCANTQN